MDEHYDALVGLAAVGLLDGRVHDTFKENDGGLVRDQYLILYRAMPDEILSERFSKVATVGDTLTFEWDWRAVGTTPKAAAEVAGLFLTNTIGRSLTVAGRSCTPLKVGVSRGRVLPDTSVKPHLFTVTGSVTTVSRPS